MSLLSFTFLFGAYSSLLLIFFVHTLVYAILFLFKYFKQRFPSNLWMSLFLFLAALYICPWMLGFAGWYASQPFRDILFYVPFQHLLLIGPVLYFYVQSMFNPKFTFTRKQLLHFLPAILYFVWCIIVVVYDKLIVKEYYFLKSQADPDFDTWYQLLGFVSMISYLVFSVKYYNEYKTIIQAVISNAADFMFSWIKHFLIAFIIIQVALISINIISYIIGFKYDQTWWYFFCFAIITYYIAIAGYNNAVESKIFFRTNIFKNENQVLFLNSKQELLLPFDDKSFETIVTEAPIDQITQAPQFEEMRQKIENVLIGEKLYEDQELTLFDVSKKMGLNVAVLSRVINQSFRLNFNDLINKYRVAAIINLINNGEHKKQTLLSIAFECGFNSKSTFNRAFKKEKGISPQEFIKSQKVQSVDY
jgi:AraC-like DNA-binding protein